jgi:transposase-like protein
MPRAIPLPIRRAIVERHQAGQSLVMIALELGLPDQTVRKLWRRYRLEGEAGLTPIITDAAGRVHPVRGG